jgi:hypothetical protein
MGFTNLNPTGSVFLVEDAANCRFQNVGFRGASTAADLGTADNASIGAGFASTSSLVCNQITFDGCVFSNLVWGIKTNQQTTAVTVSTSKFDTLFQGVALGTDPVTNGGPTGTRIVGNMFNTVYAEGIVFGTYLVLGINASGHNIFYDVGNSFSGSTGTPAFSIISIESNNNVSISDLFERTNDFAITYPRVDLGGTVSIATTNGSQLSMGDYTRLSGSSFTLANNSTGTILTFSTDTAKAFKVDYTIIRDVSYRTGTIFVASNTGSGSPTFNDVDVENSDTGITLTVNQTGTNCYLEYTSSNTGVAGIIRYSVTYLA